MSRGERVDHRHLEQSKLLHGWTLDFDSDGDTTAASSLFLPLN